VTPPLAWPPLPPFERPDESEEEQAVRAATSKATPSPRQSDLLTFQLPDSGTANAHFMVTLFSAALPATASAEAVLGERVAGPALAGAALVLLGVAGAFRAHG
jgi:hypothetical protein